MHTFKSLIQLALILTVTCTSCLKKDCEYKSKYIYEPIVFDDDCNCIVAGKVKYLKECTTVVLLDYGNGYCDNLAIKTICKNGKCEESAGAEMIEIEIDCKETITEGAISDDEALRMGF